MLYAEREEPFFILLDFHYLKVNVNRKLFVTDRSSA